MFNDSVSFNGGTRVEVVAVLANCGIDTDRARRALVTWIRRKQDKGRSTEHILIKLRDIESKFIRDTSLHNAFRDARAETYLPRPPDLPLPYSVRKRPEGEMLQPLPSPSSPGPSRVSPPPVELPAYPTRQTSPPVSPLHLSWDSHTSESQPGKPDTSRWNIPHVPQSQPPRIRIPRNKSFQPPPSAPPITSPPPDPGRFRYLSHPVTLPSQPFIEISPPSATSPESPTSPGSSRYQNSDRGSTHDLVHPIPVSPIEISRPRSRRSIPSSVLTSSSEGSDAHSRLHHAAQPKSPTSPGRRRLTLTPPRTSPPDVPLPPIPTNPDGEESSDGRLRRSLPTEPPTPVRSTILQLSTPARPLPIQPVPSPVPSSDESGPIDLISENSVRERWSGSNGMLPSGEVVREDSPVYMFQDDDDDDSPRIGIGAPPPYVDQFEAYSHPHTPTIGESLDSAVDACGGSPDVRLVVSKCVNFQSGYEPPYWHTRLQACGLSAEAAKYLVDEMSKQVNWSASFGRAT